MGGEGDRSRDSVDHVGVIVNPRAGLVQRRPGLIDAISRAAGERPIEAPASEEEIRPALEALADEGVTVVAIVGGDGTVTGTLTPLVQVWSDRGAELPRVALLPGGSVNTIPRALGGRGSPALLLRRLLRFEAGLAAARTVPLAPLRIEPQGEGVRFGMIFGIGAVARWLAHYYAGSRRGTLGATLGVAGALGSMATGGAFARSLFARFDAAVEIDDESDPEERFSAMAAGALEQIGLGFRPFHSAGRHRGRFHWISTDAGHWRMGLEVAGVALRSRPPVSRLRHASAARVRITIPHALPYTVDGDLFPATTAVDLSAGPEIGFLRA